VSVGIFQHFNMYNKCKTVFVIVYVETHAVIGTLYGETDRVRTDPGTDSEPHLVHCRL